MPEANLSTPVLIVGGGPVGLCLSIDLNYRGVPHVLIEQSDGTIEHPRTGLVAIRTMEAFRQWGLAEDVRRCGFPENYELSMVFCTSMTGLLLDREPYPSMAQAPTPPETPEKKQRCPQLWLQPILARHAAVGSHGKVLYQHRFERFEHNEQEVLVEVSDLTKNEMLTFRTQYVVACDGATSQVRQQAGINMEGRLLSYSVNILARIPKLIERSTMGEGERYMFVGPEGMWGNLTVVDGSEIWRLTVLGSEERMNLDTFDPHAWLRKALGTEADPDRIPYDILSVTPWRRSEMLAERFHEGRIILAGDSAHTMSPTGGMGMNTGVQEALDLGWKLQGLIEGWGGPELLNSYDLERRPIAKRNISFSTLNFKAWQDTPDPQAVCDDTPEGAAVRAAIGKRLRDSTRVEWESMGLQLGHRYDHSPICLDDGTPPTPDDFREYVPTSRPGSRAPHAWLPDGRSILDLFGKAFVLLYFPTEETPRKGQSTPSLSKAASETLNQAEISALRQAFAVRNIPFTDASIPSPAIASLYEAPYVLVRPDGHVAWRGSHIPDPDKIAETVRGALPAHGA